MKAPAEGATLHNRNAEPMRAMLQAARVQLCDACNALAEAADLAPTASTRRWILALRDDATSVAFDLEHGMRARQMVD